MVSMQWMITADRTITGFLRRWSVPALRISLGVVFVWFGLLKVLGVTPVTDLVGDTVYWVDPGWFVPVLGVAETAIGIALVFGRLLRLALAAMAAQLLGTFLVLVVLPDVAFQDGNPLLLTVEGEFVVKNLVLLTAGMVVGSTVRRLPQANPAGDDRAEEPLQASATSSSIESSK
jgi:uncharacterized membrane protein YphA (DoxX/SURF4 family)